MNSYKSFIIAGFLILFSVFISCQGKKAQAVEAENSANTVKVRAPDFQVADIKGNEISLESLAGKVVFVEFWATWCPPCIISAPEVEKLAVEYQGKDVEFLSINLDADYETFKNFIERNHISSHIIFSGDSQMDIKYRVRSLPSFFIIDKEGNLSAIWEGYRHSLPQTWREKINLLLNI